MTEPFDEGFAAEDFCYLSTAGRSSGKQHQIEIWFVAHQRVLYLLAGGGERADWVRNIRAQPRVSVRIGRVTRPALGRIVTDPVESALVRRLVPEKYAAHEDGLEEWATTALPVAIEPRAKRAESDGRLGTTGGSDPDDLF